MASEELPEGLREKRLLFTVTSGRSGTRLLAEVLALFRDVHARHEPKPRFSSAMRTVLAAPETARQWWLEEKLPALAKSTKPILAETSHFACKGFLGALIELGLAPELIHLQRPGRQVATSMLAMGTVPGRSYRGVKHYLSPADPNVLPLPPGAVEALSDYQLCYWYWLEIEERARIWKEAGELAVHTVTLEELISPAGVERLGSDMKLGPFALAGRTRAGRLVAQKQNSRPDKKRELTLDPSQLDDEEAAIRELAERSRAAAQA